MRFRFRHLSTTDLAIAAVAVLAQSLVLAGASGCSFPEYGGFTESGHDAGTHDSSIDQVSGRDGASDGGRDVRSEKAADVSSDVMADATQDGGHDTGQDATDAAEDVLDASADVADSSSEDSAAQDVAPPLPLLNVWHIASNQEPPSVTMRNPLYPPAGTDKLYFYVGEYRPQGEVAAATLFWQWTNALAVESPVVQSTFAWDSKNGNNDYWIASVPWPQHPVGTFRYYIRVEPKDPTSYAVTYLYGTDTVTNKTADEATAKANPYAPAVRSPKPGEVVISEIMVNPRGTSESQKEWFEVYCHATVALSLDGCWISDDKIAHETAVKAPWLVLWPGAYATMGASLNVTNMEGFLPDYSYEAAFSLNNTGDAVRLLAADKTTIIDEVDFSSWPAGLCCDGNPDGRSSQLNLDTPDSSANDQSSSWCRSTQTYGQGTSMGTPNGPTDHCP